MQHFKNFGKIQSFYFPTVHNISKLYQIWRQKSSPASNGLIQNIALSFHSFVFVQCARLFAFAHSVVHARAHDCFVIWAFTTNMSHIYCTCFVTDCDEKIFPEEKNKDRTTNTKFAEILIFSYIPYFVNLK